MVVTDISLVLIVRQLPTLYLIGAGQGGYFGMKSLTYGPYDMGLGGRYYSHTIFLSGSGGGQVPSQLSGCTYNPLAGCINLSSQHATHNNSHVTITIIASVTHQLTL